MEFEDILKEVGDWGRFQKFLNAFYGSAVSLASAISGMSLLFLVMVPDIICQKNPSMSLLAGTENVTDPLNDLSCHTNDSSGKDTCHVGWMYDTTYLDATAATKWNMICEKKHYPSLILTLQNVGSLIGGTIYGTLADRFGRKVLCFGLLILAAVTDIASVFVDSLFFFCILRTVNGTVLPTMYILPYVLVSEFMPPNKRVLVNVVFNCGWMVGMCILPLAVYLMRNWQILGIFSSICIVSILLFWSYVPESASWLVSRSRYDDATKVMLSIGKRNKKSIDKDVMTQKLKELGRKMKLNKEKENTNFFAMLVKYPRLRKHFLILTFCWMVNQTAYLGFQYNVINLSGNVFLNYFLLSVVEAPGNLLFWLAMEKIGRRWSGSAGYLLIALFCLLPLSGFKYSDVVSSILGKMISSGIFMNVDQQGCELFPTAARSSAVGIGKSISMIVSMFSPFLAYLSNYGKTIPFLILCFMTLMASVLSSLLPETRNENLPQTFLHAESLGKDHKFFSLNRNKFSSHDKHLNEEEIKLKSSNS